MRPAGQFPIESARGTRDRRRPTDVRSILRPDLDRGTGLDSPLRDYASCIGPLRRGGDANLANRDEMALTARFRDWGDCACNAPFAAQGRPGIKDRRGPP